MTVLSPLPIRRTELRLGCMAGWDAAIVIPAKNEEARLPACLKAAEVAARMASDRTVGIVVVVNNTTDASALRAFGWAAAQFFVPFVLIDCDFSAAQAGVGAARRLGLDTACRHLAAHGALLTTDADTLVRDDWVIRNLAELRGADLICGTVLMHPDEARALPPSIAAHGDAEQDYLAASIRLVARLDPQPHDPDPPHHNAAGASMAVSRQVYMAVGGLPAVPLCEDRAFAERVEVHDFRIRFSDTAIVETSARMTGRTDGGLAGALRARLREPDALVDEWLERAETLALRHGLRGRLRAKWPDADALHDVLSAFFGQADADRIMPRPPGRHFGAFFACVERNALRLARHRLRQSDCRRDLPKLQALLAAVEPAQTSHLARVATAARNRADV